MTDDLSNQLKRLRHSMATLETQRVILGDDAVDPAIGLLRTQIATLEARKAGESDQPEDRRIVTIFFSDIVGSTKLAEKLDPEDWRETVSAVHTMAGNLVRDHGGIVIQYLGDGLLALFGAKIPSERDPERSIRAALGVQEGIDSIQASLPVQLRIGIHTGLVVTGEMGSDVKREFTATGDSMNLAARLQSAAPPGGVLISRETYRHVRGIFDVDAQPPLSAKGRVNPVQTYLVLRARARPFRAVTRGVRGVDTHTVGRDPELRQLRRICRDALAHGKVMWAQLVGEPGVGKTRILTDMAEALELAPENLLWLRACAVDGDVQQPLALVRRMWFNHFQIAEDLPIAEAEDRWVEEFPRLQGQDDLEAAQALGLLVGLPFAQSAAIGAMRDDPVQVKGRAFAVSRERLALIRGKRPLIILIEDLHWADQSSWEYITEVLLDEAEGDLPNGLFILATARSEWEPRASLLNHPGYVQIDVSPLSASASHDLVGDLLQHVEQIPDQVISSIVERAEGVPYFAEEMVNWLLDRGVIDRRYEPWHFIPDRFEEMPLPETLQHLLFTRLGSLSFTQQEILQRGSIFGRDFWEGGLLALDIHPPDEMIGDLEQRGFIKEQPISAFVDQREWSFRHNLMRDVAYESVLKRRRPGLHQSAGGWLETQARRAGRLDEFSGRIGSHAELAGDADAAADWYTRAGERAWSQGAIIEAGGLFNRALELLPPTDRERRWHVFLKRDEVLSALGEHELRNAGISTLLELAREFNDPNRLAEAQYRQGVFYDSAGDQRNALAALDSALGLAHETKDHRLEGLALALIVACHTRLGELELAAASAEKALSLCESLEDNAALARILNNVAIYFTETGDIAEAARLYQEQIDVNNRQGDKAGEAMGLGNLGFIYLQMGMYDESREALEESMRLNSALGVRRTLAYNLLNLGLVQWRLGNAQASQQLIEQAKPILTGIGDKFGIGILLSYTGLSLELQGDLKAAAKTFMEAKSTLEEMGLIGFAQDSLAGLVRCRLAQGMNEDALEGANELWGYLREHGAAGLEFPMNAFLTCADVFDALGEGERSRDALEVGRRELMDRASKIGDEDWCNRYLENVPEHRSLREDWDRKTGEAARSQGGYQSEEGFP